MVDLCLLLVLVGYGLWLSHFLKLLQWKLNSSNTDGLFTMADSNLFVSPYENLPLAQENKYTIMVWEIEKVP